MTSHRALKLLLATGPLALLAACGGGGGGIASAPLPPAAPAPAPAPTPAPSPAPTPTPADTSVELLDHPATQELAIATRGEPIRIRYDAVQDRYEVKADAFDWSALVDESPPLQNPFYPNQGFEIEEQTGSKQFDILAHYRLSDTAYKYHYSNIAQWRPGKRAGNDPDLGDFGEFVALGVPTPSSGVPQTGSAHFDGLANGVADVPNTAWGAPIVTTPLSGTVSLDFDFSNGALSGFMTLPHPCDCTTYVGLERLDFSDTIFARGSQTFSGRFATGVAGNNAFDGRFTGPGAEELIGSWIVPFLHDGALHQAWGAWIAKQDK